jgi:UDP-glucuronate 4-epimerase
MKTILVTGCAGFIGSHLCEFLVLNNFSVIGIDNFDNFYSKNVKLKNLESLQQSPNFQFIEADIRSSSSFSKIQGNIDVIIHLAAKAGVLPSIQAPQDYIDTNIIGTQNVLEFMKQKQIYKLLFASSSSVYGNAKTIPFIETQAVDEPISPYAFTKKACELMNYTYHHLYNFDIINLRFFYGVRSKTTA